MILNFLRVAECPLEYMVSSSYSEYHSQKANARDIIAASKLRSTIDALQQSIKTISTSDLKAYFNACQQFWNLLSRLQQTLVEHDKVSHRLLDDVLKCGCVVRIRDAYETDIPAIVLDGSFSSSGKNMNHQRLISVLVISQAKDHVLSDVDRLILKEDEAVFVLPVRKWKPDATNDEQQRLIYQIKNIDVTDLMDITDEIVPQVNYQEVIEGHWSQRMSDTIDIELESTKGRDKALRQAIDKLKLVRENASDRSSRFTVGISSSKPDDTLFL